MTQGCCNLLIHLYSARYATFGLEPEGPEYFVKTEDQMIELRWRNQTKSILDAMLSSGGRLDYGFWSSLILIQMFSTGGRVDVLKALRVQFPDSSRRAWMWRTGGRTQM